MKKLQVERYRCLQQRGYIKCGTHFASLLESNQLPCELGPETPTEAGFMVPWAPLWIVWYLRSNGGLTPQKLVQVQEAASDPETKYVLFTALLLQGRALEALAQTDSSDRLIGDTSIEDMLLSIHYTTRALKEEARGGFNRCT